MKKEKDLQKEEVFLLRKTGLSLRDIHKKTGIARSTISMWARTIEHTEEEQIKLKETKSFGSVRAASTHNLQKKLRHETYIETGKQLAIQHYSDPNFAAGCFLYWGEGSKLDYVNFCNTDPEAVYFFVKWITKYFNVSDKIFVARLVYHTNGIFSEEEIKTFWEQKLKPLSFRWGGIRYIPGKENKKGKCPYGIFSIRFNSIEINDIIFGAVKHIAGFDRISWSFKI